jgi:hypothetical protein
MPGCAASLQSMGFATGLATGSHVIGGVQAVAGYRLLVLGY